MYQENQCQMFDFFCICKLEIHRELRSLRSIVWSQEAKEVTEVKSRKEIGKISKIVNGICRLTCRLELSVLKKSSFCTITLFACEDHLSSFQQLRVNLTQRNFFMGFNTTITFILLSTL